MRLDSLFYRFAYRFRRPRWDTDEPRPELKELLEGRPAGRALDLGCGTGTDARYLAEQGWTVVGMDFVPQAIETAKARVLNAGSPVRFVVGERHEPPRGRNRRPLRPPGGCRLLPRDPRQPPTGLCRRSRRGGSTRRRPLPGWHIQSPADVALAGCSRRHPCRAPPALRSRLRRGR